MRIGICGVVAALSLTGCSAPDEATENVVGRVKADDADVSAKTKGDELEATSDTPPKPKAKAVNFTDNEKDGEAEREFSYAWPAKVSAEPELAKKLTAERDEALAAQKSEWRAAVHEYGTDDCVTCVNRDYSTEWEVVADTGRFLSLSAGNYIYTGGAHSNSGFAGLVWDRKAGASMDARQMFNSPGALWSVARRRYCRALDKEREKRRGRPVEAGDFAAECPKLDELTLLVGSSNGKTFNRLGFLADPYVAGPYAEGPYEVTLPVNSDILEAVKSEYREYFSLGK